MTSCHTIKDKPRSKIFGILSKLLCNKEDDFSAHHYWGECSLEPLIPVWNLIDAIFGISFLVMEMVEKLLLLPDVLEKLRVRGIRIKASSVKTVSTATRGFCAVFLCLWFFTGKHDLSRGSMFFIPTLRYTLFRTIVLPPSVQFENTCHS